MLKRGAAAMIAAKSRTLVNNRAYSGYAWCYCRRRGASELMPEFFVECADAHGETQAIELDRSALRPNLTVANAGCGG
jgi:hypothetical protein